MSENDSVPCALRPETWHVAAILHKPINYNFFRNLLYQFSLLFVINTRQQSSKLENLI